MAKQKWDGKMVALRLEEAAATLKRLPEKKIQQLQAHWPETIPTWADYGDEKTKMRLTPPSPDAIDRMDETLAWLSWLEPDQVRLVWARAERIPWKLIMRQFGRARSTLSAWWMAALCQVAGILNNTKKVSGQQITRHDTQDLP
jgi:hypothetical protein